jgi:nitroreductase
MLVLGIVMVMDVYTAIISRRTIRRFQKKPIKLDLLRRFVNAARLAPSAANLQPL